MTSAMGDLWSARVRKTRLNPKATAPKIPTQPIFLKALTTFDLQDQVRLKHNINPISRCRQNTICQSVISPNARIKTPLKLANVAAVMSIKNANG